MSAVAACLCLAGRALADTAEPGDLAGIERPAHQAAEPLRDLAHVLLWPLRLTVDFLFLATGTAGGLLENEQIVPRARELFFTRGNQLGVFPTFFVETGSSPNIGARFIANLEPFAATLRAGYGGQDENVVESRLRLRFAFPQPAILSLEGLHDWRTGLGFSGVGQTPATDSRNQFRGAPAVGEFRERRQRLVVGAGLRPLENIEVLVSASVTRRYVDDPPDAPTGTVLTRVFLPSTIPGALATTSIIYGELAFRLDTRSNRSGDAVGVLFEGYAGVADGVLQTSTDFARAGFQAAGFFSVGHSTNILSPKLVVDGLASLAGDDLPFRELVGQPTFRGLDTRRDNVSAVASLDYRWYLMRFFAARLFWDVARVLPSLSDLSVARSRWVAGFGFDLTTSTSELGRIALAIGPEGYNFLVTLGVPVRFGDRQHRE